MKCRFLFITAWCLFLCACYPGWRVPSRPEIFISRHLGHYARTARVAVIPFRNDYFDRQLGTRAAGCIKQALLHKDLFAEITVIEDAFWHNRKVDTGTVINQALYDVQAEGFDLLIVGAVKAYQPSSAAETKAVVSARLIEIASGKTLWWGQASCTGRRGKTFLLWAENLSPDPPSAHYLLQKSAEKIAAALRRAG